MEKVIEKISILLLLGKRITFRRIQDVYFKALFILLYLFFISILLKIAIFGDFSNINQFPTKNGMISGQLH